MKLVIDTTQKDIFLFLLLDPKARVLARLKKRHWGRLSESFLPELEKFLQKNKAKLESLKKILINPGPGAFSATRTGVATANALAYALGIPIAEWPSRKVKDLIIPKYDREPNITKPTKMSFRT